MIGSATFIGDAWFKRIIPLKMFHLSHKIEIKLSVQANRKRLLLHPSDSSHYSILTSLVEESLTHSSTNRLFTFEFQFNISLSLTQMKLYMDLFDVFVDAEGNKICTTLIRNYYCIAIIAICVLYHDPCEVTQVEKLSSKA